MAKTNGLFGKVSGKVAQLVFATWKGIEYVRLYVIPANPNTAAQQLVRLKFIGAVRFAKSILGSVLQPFVDPFLKAVSAYAHQVGRCMTAWAAGIDWQAFFITEGTLESTPITGATLAGTDVTITWDSTVLGNGAPTDVAGAVVYDIVNGVSFFNATATRTDGTVAVAVGAGRVAANLKAYLFFTDDATAPTVTSNSAALAVT